MDAIDFNSCRRDMFHLFIMFHNMALCYQKMQMLEECAQCIEHALEHLPLSLLNLEEKSISNRMRKVFIIGKLKLQYCAILSQIHRHKDALTQARDGVRICHQMVEDMNQLCNFYVKREKINMAYKDTNQEQMENYSSRFDRNKDNQNSSRNRSFSSFLCQQEAYTGFDSLQMSVNHTNNKSVNSFKGPRKHSVGHASSTNNISQASSM